jgi:hypothetical protein
LAVCHLLATSVAPAAPLQDPDQQREYGEDWAETFALMTIAGRPEGYAPGSARTSSTQP